MQEKNVEENKIGVESKPAKPQKEPRKNVQKENFFKRHGIFRFEFDHAARFYPILSTKKSQSNFTVGAVLDENIDAELLERAVNECIVRFPSFKVKQKRGYAWHYLVENNAPIKVFPLDEFVPCPIDRKKTNGYLFKLTCGGNRIEMTMFHGLCDGNGAIELLKTIVLAYTRLKGVRVENVEGILDHGDAYTTEELEDSFLAHYVPIKLGEIDFKKLLGGKPYKIGGELLKKGTQTDSLVVPCSEVIGRAKRVGVSFTAYVTGLIAATLDEMGDAKKKRDYVIMIPVNLRNLFESSSLRNFVTFIRVIVKPHSCATAEEYAIEAQRQIIEESASNKMARFISTSVKAQRSFLMKITPLFVKQFFLKLGRLFAQSRQTIIFSNIGRVQVPKELEVEYFYVNMNTSKNNAQNMSAVTTDGKAVFTLTRAVKEKDFSNRLFALIEKGE